MTWVTSDLCHALETTGLLLDGKCIFGDNAYIKKIYMSVPLKGIVGQYDAAYSFYCSQLRIMIDRAFGVLVHRWSILRRPLTCPSSKVGPLVIYCCRLHNFCIDVKDEDTLRISDNDATYAVQFMDTLYNRVGNRVAGDAALQRLDRRIPNGLLHGGSDFHDAPHNRSGPVDRCPMDDMMAQVKRLNLARPMSTK